MIDGKNYMRVEKGRRPGYIDVYPYTKGRLTPKQDKASVNRIRLEDVILLVRRAKWVDYKGKEIILITKRGD